MSDSYPGNTSTAPEPTAPTTKDQLREALAEFGGLQFDIEAMTARREELRKVITQLSAQIQQAAKGV